MPDNHVDVVISDCVINLSGDKARVLREAFRVLKPGGRLGISDVLANHDTSPDQLARAEEQIGCVAGTLTPPEYEHLLAAAGFCGISVTPTTKAADGAPRGRHPGRETSGRLASRRLTDSPVAMARQRRIR